MLPSGFMPPAPAPCPGGYVEEQEPAPKKVRLEPAAAAGAHPAMLYPGMVAGMPPPMVLPGMPPVLPGMVPGEPRPV